jgi:hypothetical protein
MKRGHPAEDVPDRVMENIFNDIIDSVTLDEIFDVSMMRQFHLNINLR